MVKVIMDQILRLIIESIILIVMLYRTLGQVMPFKPYHCITEEDWKTCQSCQEDGGASNLQSICRLNATPTCDVCCAMCQPCDVCGLGRFLYHDFEGRACRWNSNVICCEERNMDVVNDVCVHRTTTVQTTTVKATHITPTKSLVPLYNREQLPLTAPYLGGCASGVMQCKALLISSVLALLISVR